MVILWRETVESALKAGRLSADSWPCYTGRRKVTHSSSRH